MKEKASFAGSMDAPEGWDHWYDDGWVVEGEWVVVVLACEREDLVASILVLWDGISESASIVLEENAASDGFSVLGVDGGLVAGAVRERRKRMLDGKVEFSPSVDIDVAVEDVQSKVDEVAAAWINAIENRS